MFHRPASPDLLRLVGKAAVLAAVLALTAFLGIEASRHTNNVAAVWPPNGIALAVLLPAKPRQWPVYAAAAAVANFGINLAWGDSLFVSAGFATCNTGEVLLAFGLLRRLTADSDLLGSVRSLLLFLGVIAASTALSATLGAGLISVAFGAPYWTVWRTWWIGDAVGLLILTPLCLAWHGVRWRKLWVDGRRSETAVLVAGFMVTTLAVFNTPYANDALEHLLPLLILPFQIAMTLRMGARGATATNAFIAGTGVVTILTGSGLFTAHPNPVDAISNFQALLSAAATTSLMLAAALSERRQAERRVIAAESRLRDAIESLTEGFALFDAEDRLILCNEPYKDLHGAQAGIIVPGVSFETVVRASAAAGQFPVEPDQLESWVADRLRRHRDPQGPFEHALSDGRWLQIAEQRTADGGFVGVRTDITRLKTKQRQLHESEERFRRVVEASPSALVMIDQTGRIALVNGLAERIFGYERDELIGQPVEVLVPERARAAHPGRRAGFFAAPSARAMGSGRDLFARRKDGSEFPVEIGLNPIATAAGAMVLSAIVDISQRKQAEEQLNQYQRHDAIGQLTGGVAHEFNNLMAIILGNAEMLQEVVRGTKAAADIAQRIVSASVRGGELTQQLLAFSRRQPLRPESIDVGGALQNLHRLARVAIPEIIEIDIAASPGLHLIRADKLQLENALLNLALNARDAMPTGGRIRIRARNRTVDARDDAGAGRLDAGDYVAVEVVDNGHGMSKETIARAVEPFFTTKEVGKGTGLGLSMVHGFCKQSGGELEIESKQGSGTTVRMLLPSAGPVAETLPAVTLLPRAPHGDAVVLVVEDEPELLATAAAMIRGLGYRVIEALDGHAALEALDLSDRVDVLFTDVIMPKGMSGPELARTAVGRQPDLKVIFTSGYNEIVDAQTDDVVLLRKPCNRLELARALMAATQASPRSPAARDLATG